MACESLIKFGQKKARRSPWFGASGFGMANSGDKADFIGGWRPLPDRYSHFSHKPQVTNRQSSAEPPHDFIAMRPLKEWFAVLEG